MDTGRKPRPPTIRQPHQPLATLPGEAPIPARPFTLVVDYASLERAILAHLTLCAEKESK